MKALSVLLITLFSLSALAGSNSSLIGEYIEKTRTSTLSIRSEQECTDIGGNYLPAGDLDVAACVYDVQNTVKISSKSSGELALEVLTVGSNEHNCSFDGTADAKGGDVFEVKALDTNSSCILEVSVQGTSLSVKEKSGACYEFCGARASLDISKADKK